MIKLQIWKGLTLVLTHTHIFYRYFRLEIWSPHIQYIHASTKPTHASSLLTIQIQWGGRGRSSKSSVVEPRNSQCEIFSWDFAISFSKDLFMKIVRFTFSSSMYSQWSWAVVQREKKIMAYDLHPVLIPYLVSQNSSKLKIFNQGFLSNCDLRVFPLYPHSRFQGFNL